MAVQKRWSFGLGTVFSLIVVYFIFLYSRERGWVLLATISKWYLIIIGSLFALSLVLILLILLIILALFVIAMLKLHSARRKQRKGKNKDYVDVQYRIKE